MKKIKNVLLALLSITFISAAVGFVGCNDGGENSSNAGNSSTESSVEDSSSVENEPSKEETPSECVEYSLNDDGASYSVTGCRECKGLDVVIASTYQGLPVTKISEQAFRNCEMKSVKIPSSVKVIETYAFYGCDLTEIIIPEGVLSIGDRAFESCTYATDVFISASVTSIGELAFTLCSAIENITVAENNTAYQSIDGSLYTKDGTTLVQYAIQKTATELVIPDGVTTIARGALATSHNLTSITLPDSLTSIGIVAFYWCTNLESIKIPAGVSVISESAFYGCYALEELDLGNVTKIEDSAFSQCPLTSVTLPNGLLSIGRDAFSGNLTSVKIPATVTYIGPNAFSSDTLTIYCEAESQPSGWEENWNAGNRPIVWDCNNNDKADDGKIYVVADGLRYTIQDGTATVVRQLRSVTTANIPAMVTYKDAEYSVTAIEETAFNSCSQLASVTIPDSVTAIGSNAFSYCPSLKSITISDNVLTIGQDAFASCDQLLIYCTAESQPEAWENDWNSLTPVVWDCNNSDEASDGYIYTVIDGVRYALKEGKAEVNRLMTEAASIQIPASITYQDETYNITKIGKRAFLECTSLTSIELPDSVTLMDEFAFYGCTSLTNIEIPDSVTVIGYGVFYGCTSLTSIEIPDSVTEIGIEAFRETGLTSVKIPSGITKIDVLTFALCEELTSIEIPDSVTVIEYGGLNGCTSLTSVVIPAGVTSIGVMALEGCTSLTSVIFKGTVAEWEAIGYNGWIDTPIEEIVCSDGTITFE